MCEYHSHLIRVRKSMGVVKPIPIVHNLRGEKEREGEGGLIQQLGKKLIIYYNVILIHITMSSTCVHVVIYNFFSSSSFILSFLFLSHQFLLNTFAMAIKKMPTSF